MTQSKETMSLALILFFTMLTMARLCSPLDAYCSGVHDDATMFSQFSD